MGTNTMSVAIQHGVRAARNAAHLSQAELSERLNDHGIACYPTTIAKVEAGDRSLRAEEFVAIAEVLGVSMESLGGSYKGEDRDAYDAGYSAALRDVSESLATLTAPR